MTIHNLKEHLSWLLRSETAVPPPGDSSLIQRLSAATIIVEEGFNSLEGLLDRPIATADVDFRNVAEPRTLTEFVGPSLAASSGDLETGVGEAGVEEAGVEMARLQTGPRSATKSRLMSQVSPDLSKTPTPRATPSNSASLKDQYSAYYGDNTNSKC